MRGTGYAIGEILIFLAIAAIIGFLIGWLVFYRRPNNGANQLSPVNPNHVRRLEERSKAVDAKLVRIEKRANALLELLAKAPRRSGEPDTAGPQPIPVGPDTVIAPAAAAPAAGAEATPDDSAADVEDAAVVQETEHAADRSAGDASEDKGQAPDSAEDTKSDVETAASVEEVMDTAGAAPAGEANADGEAAEAPGTVPEEPAAAHTDEAASDGPEAKDIGGDVDDYLSEADERISKLEETLDKLSEKLAEFEND